MSDKWSVTDRIDGVDVEAFADGVELTKIRTAGPDGVTEWACNAGAWTDVDPPGWALAWATKWVGLLGPIRPVPNGGAS